MIVTYESTICGQSRPIVVGIANLIPKTGTNGTPATVLAVSLEETKLSVGGG